MSEDKLCLGGVGSIMVQAVMAAQVLLYARLYRNYGIKSWVYKTSDQASVMNLCSNFLTFVSD